MKKTLLIITSLIMLCILTIGCQTTDATITTSNELNKNLNLLSNTVSRLDTVDNEYLVNNEIYTLNSNTPTPQMVEKKTLAYNINADQISLNDDLQKALTNELINRIYCDSNGNCKICDEKFVCNDDNMCGSCNQTIVCDSNGNCTSCNKTLYIDENNNCTNCKASCVTNKCNSNISDSTKTLLQKISTKNKELVAEPIALNNTINDLPINIDSDNDILVDDNNLSYNDTNQTLNNNIDDNNSTTDSVDSSNIDDENLSNNSYIQLYYFEETVPINYAPRFASNINYDMANSNITSYMNKLQKLYAMTTDVIEANNTLANYKVLILDNIDETKNLNNCILTGNCTPSNNQVLALNNYIEDIKSTIYNLRRCNGNLTNEINKISAANTGLSHSLDITNSNYLRILNQIDTRISYHENAIATLEEIQTLLQEAQNNKNINNDTLVEDMNNSNIIDNDTINDTTVNNDSFNNEDNIINNNEDINNLDNNNEYEIDNSNNNLDNNIATGNDESTITNNSNIDNIDEEFTYNDMNNVNDSDNKESEEVENNSSNNINDENVDENTNNNVSDEINDNESSTDTEEETFSNVDTYESNINNLDDFRVTKDIIADPALESNNNIETEIDTNNNSTANSNNVIDNNNVTNNSNIVPQMVDGTINNTNNNNSIISQNNLNNNDIGNNSYRYDSNGSLYNNTNGYNNNGINNVNNKNTNVNTYKYNTLVDSINRGTIDNGINNL